MFTPLLPGKRKDANLLAPRRAKRTSWTPVNLTSSQVRQSPAAGTWVGSGHHLFTHQKETLSHQMESVHKKPTLYESCSPLNSALYIYLTLSGLVHFLPAFCKYLYLDQNILTKYKRTTRSHGVIVLAMDKVTQ
jgi:hypothetical protein